MSFNDLNDSSLEEDNNKGEIKLSPKELTLYMKVGNFFSNSDGIELGEYDYNKISEGDEVKKKLEEFGLLEVFEKFKKKLFTLPMRDEKEKEFESNRLARIILKFKDILK